MFRFRNNHGVFHKRNWVFPLLFYYISIAGRNLGERQTLFSGHSDTPDIIYHSEYIRTSGSWNSSVEGQRTSSRTSSSARLGPLKLGCEKNCKEDRSNTRNFLTKSTDYTFILYILLMIQNYNQCDKYLRKIYWYGWNTVWQSENECKIQFQYSALWELFPSIIRDMEKCLDLIAYEN